MTEYKLHPFILKLLLFITLSVSISICQAQTISFDKIVSTFAGNGTAGNVNGAGSHALFNSPEGLAVDASGNIYVADLSNHSIRKITPSGMVTTIAGNGIAGFADGMGADAQFNHPRRLALDAAGNIYVADMDNNRIRKIDLSGFVTTVAGNGTAGLVNGPVAAAQFNSPSGIAVDAAGNIYVADTYNEQIRKITPDGMVSTFAGGIEGFADGQGTSAQFADPQDIAIDVSGNLYVTDLSNARIRKINPSGFVSTLAGSGILGINDGSATEAQFWTIAGLTVDASGYVYTVENFFNKIRKISPSGEVTTFSGSGEGFLDGLLLNSQYRNPADVVTDGAGNIYIADANNHSIRKFSPNGLNPFISISGTASTIQKFNVSGTELTDNILVNAPAGYEISLSQTSGFGASLSLVPNAGNVSSTVIYIRLSAGNASGTYNGDITLNSLGALSQLLPVTGNVNATKLAQTINFSSMTAKAYGDPSFILNAFASSGLPVSFSSSNTSIATIVGNVVTIHSAGTVTIYASQSGNEYYNAATNVTKPLQINKTNQSINFSSLTSKTFGDIPFTLSATASSGLGVTYASSNTAVAAVSGNTVTIVGAGTTNITANQAGNINYNAATAVVRALVVNKNSQTITFNVIPNKTLGEASFILSATASSGLTVSYTSSNTSVATISGNTVTIVGAGTTNITASQVGNSNYNAATNVVQPFVVDSKSTILTFDAVVSTISPSFTNPTDVAYDNAGNLIICDNFGNRIRKMTPAGVVSTIAGTSSAGFADGTGTSARFDNPNSIAIDPSNNIYVADEDNHRIRKVTPDGVVTTVAGTGVEGTNNGPAAQATFTFPHAIVMDASGNLYVADSYKIRKITSDGIVSTFAEFGYGVKDIAIDANGYLYAPSNNKIYKISPSGVITNFAGSGIVGFADGTATAAKFNSPLGITVDNLGNVYVTDFGNYKLRKISPTGLVTTLAGKGTSTTIDGPGGIAAFDNPVGLMMDPSNNIIIATNDVIRKVTPARLNDFTSIYGTASATQIFSVSGMTLSSNVNVTAPTGYEISLTAASGYVGSLSLTPVSGTLAFTPIYIRLKASNDAGSYSGNIILNYSGLSDQYLPVNGNVTKKDQTITFGTLTATTLGVASYNLTATASSGLNVTYVSSNTAVATISGNTITIVGSGFATITASQPGNNNYNAATDVNQPLTVSLPTVSYESTVSTFAGQATSGYVDGSISNAKFNAPVGIAMDVSGNIYVADMTNYRIRKITPDGTVSTFAGSGTNGLADGVGTSAEFKLIADIAIDSDGNLFVSDGNRIRKITKDGIVTTFAGGTAGYLDGMGTAAQFNFPRGLTTDASGNIYVADGYNNKIRKISPDGLVSTIAGTTSGFADGTITNAQFSYPADVVVDISGNIYVTDQSNFRIRKIGIDGEVTTIAGSGSMGYFDGPGNVAKLYTPFFISMDAKGNLYVTEPYDIRKITPSGEVSTFAGNVGYGFADGPAGTSKFYGPRGMLFDSEGNLYICDVSNHRIRKITNSKLNVFTTSIGTPSLEQSFKVIGKSLSGNLVVTAPSGYEVSLTAQSGYSSTINLTPVNGTVTTTTVFIRLNASSSGIYNGDIVLSSNSASAQYLSIAGIISGDTKLPQTITFDGLNAHTYGDSEFQLTATSSSGLPITYTSSNPAIATISGNTVTIIGAGTTIITASQAGNENYLSASEVTQSFIVNKENQVITFSPIIAKTYGAPDFTLEASSDSGLPISYTSSNPSVVTISGATVTIVGAGTAIITASQTGNENYLAASEVTQSFIVNKGNQVITFSPIIAKTYGDPDFTLEASSDSGLPISYTSSNLSVVTISGATVTIVGAGTAIITASQTGNKNYEAAFNVGQSLVVNKANQEITFELLPNKVYGTPDFVLTAYSSAGLAISYASSDPTVASISGNMVTIENAGISYISATQAGNENYNEAIVVTRSLTVTQAEQVITFEALPSKTINDSNFELVASASSGLPVVYESTNTSVAIISGNIVTIVGEGTTNIIARQSGNENYYEAVSISHSLSVSPISNIGKQLTIDVNIYPKPATETIYLSLTQPFINNTVIRLFDINGKIVKTSDLQSGNTIYKMIISDLPSGVYMMEISNQDGVAWEKIIKN